MRRARLGLTLIELLIALAMTAVIAGALSQAFYTVVHYEMKAPASRDAIQAQINFEDRMRAILQAAYLSPTATDETTYLIGTTAGQDPNGAPNLTQYQQAPSAAAGAGATTGTTGTNTTAGAAGTNTASGQTATPNIGGTSDGIVLTCLGQQIPPEYLLATGVGLTDDSTQNGPTGGSQNFQQLQSLPNGQEIVSDLTTLNSTYGPQGGVAEISITKQAVGDPGQYSGDIYMRVQRPGDADYTQGGTEQVLDSNVDHMTLEFFDGVQWDGGWDTTTGNGRHLPAAIRVHYWMKSDPNTEHIFVVQIPLSDLTPANPLSLTATTTTTTNGAGGTFGGGTGAGAGGAGGGAGGRTGAGGGGTGGRTGAGLAPMALPGVLPLFSNFKIEPDMPHADAGANATLAPQVDLGSATASKNTAVNPTPFWARASNPFGYGPEGDLLQAHIPNAPSSPVKPKTASTATPKIAGTPFGPTALSAVLSPSTPPRSAPISSATSKTADSPPPMASPKTSRQVLSPAKSRVNLVPSAKVGPQ